MNYLISNISNFHQELKDERKKDQAGKLIQYCKINFLFQKSLLVNEVVIFQFQFLFSRNPMKR